MQTMAPPEESLKERFVRIDEKFDRVDERFVEVNRRITETAKETDRRRRRWTDGLRRRRRGSLGAWMGSRRKCVD
jgi:hypothetical protein